MNVTEIVDFKNKCTGCGACFNSCCVNAISMWRDEAGFLLPKVNAQACVNCGDCVEVCQIQNSLIPENENMQELFAFQAADEELLVNATSGGLFPVMAQEVINSGGIVFGAAYTEDMSVRHIGIQCLSELERFNGSKYVQGDACDSFPQVKALLETGKPVLYSGTPCQINGLKLFLGKEYNNLTTIDVICYGVPGQAFFKKYIEMVEAEENATVVDFKFRDKHEYGWSHTVVITFKKADGKAYKKTYGNEYNNLWYRAWRYGDCLRESCYTCELVSKKRVADFTMGNFWGIENVSESFDINKGVSFLSINNPSKRDFVKTLADKGFLEPQDWSMPEKYQHGLQHTKDRTKNRDLFYASLDKGYMNMINTLYPIGIKDKLFMKVPIKMQKTVLCIAKLIGRI